MASGLNKRFGQVQAVADFHLRVPKAQIYGFLGPNGSGKSTTIRMLCGLLLPDSGSISVLGHSIPAEAEQLPRKGGSMTQRFSLYEDLSAVENLDFIAQIYNLARQRRKTRLQEVTERFGLAGFLQQRAGSLSGGQKQRLALAAATLHQPELLFLDEPTSAVDPENRRAFWETLFDLVAEGTTILVSTHYMDEAERCHALAILDRGRLVAEGSPQQLAQSIPAQVIRLHSDQPRRAGKHLESLEWVQSSAQVGTSLRILVDKDVTDAATRVRQEVATAGLQASDCSLVTPSLEDVFVAVTRERRQAA